MPIGQEQSDSVVQRVARFRRQIVIEHIQGYERIEAAPAFSHSTHFQLLRSNGKILLPEL